jgi:hypothetical protein
MRDCGNERSPACSLAVWRLGVGGGDALELRVRRLEAERRQPLRGRSPDHFTASQPSGSISNASVSR